MSSILRKVVGEDKFHGVKFPQEERLEQMKRNMRPIDFYIKDKAEPGWNDVKYKDLNPNGFWECPWTVRGCSRYDSRPTELEGAKIVSQGLANSNPEAISRVLYMVRDPHSVAKSQERLKRKFDNAGTVHSPEMFIKVHQQAARWIVGHKPDVRVVNFDDLVADPASVLSDLDAWVEGVGFPGKFMDSVGEIEPRLRRSADHETPQQSAEDDAWEDAESIHASLLEGDFESVASHKRTKLDPLRNFYCVRLNQPMPAAACKHCLSDKDTRNNFKKTAEQRQIDWRKEPCTYQCKVDNMKIEESVALNHWR